MNRFQQFGSAFAVNRSVVELGVERKRSGRETIDVVEALNDVDLPERLASIQWARMQPRYLDA